MRDKLNGRGVIYCRACDSRNLREVIDLNSSPLANSLPPLVSDKNEKFFPLLFKICEDCLLGQIGEFESPEEIFGFYPYLSSTSSTWLEHGRKFVSTILNLYPSIHDGYVLELASNDGYLLSQFKSLGVRVQGVEPARNIADIAIDKGIPTISEFFGLSLADRILNSFDYPKLIVANNVAAHVPDILDFFAGIARLCGAETIISIENPSLGFLLEENYYDTIYHEHYSYLSVRSISKIANKVGLEIFEVQELATHGGSLRYILAKSGLRIVAPSVKRIMNDESRRGVDSSDHWQAFSKNVEISTKELGDWVESQPDNSIIGYGAAAKTVTTFHAAKLLEKKFKFIIDSNPIKHGMRLPGTKLEITSLEHLRGENSPILVFPWNLSPEISENILAVNPHSQIWTHNKMRRLN